MTSSRQTGVAPVPVREAAALPHLTVVKDVDLTPDQRDEITRLYIICFLPESGVTTRSQSMETLRNFLSGQRLFQWYLVTVHDRLVAMASVIYDYERAFLTDINQTMGENLVNVAVHPAYRRQGVARWLVQEVIHHQRGSNGAGGGAGGHPLVMAIRRDSPFFGILVRFYESLGFTVRDDRSPVARYYQRNDS